MEDNFDLTAQGRPFRMIDGRKWVLADDEPWDPAPPENLDRFAPPPREVPLAVRLRLMFGSGIGSVFGFFFGGFGLMFALVAVYLFGIEDAIPRHWEPGGQATITRIEDTNMSVNNVRYYRFQLDVTAPDGQKSIVTLRRPQQGKKAGDVVTIERSGRHYRFQGDRADYGIWLFVGVGTLFGCIGLSIVGYSIVAGRRTIRLLRDGEVGEGTFLTATPTGMNVNDQAVMKVTFQHMVDNEPHTVSVRSLHHESLTDGTKKVVLYDSYRPDHGIVFEGLPSGVTLDEMTGRFHASILPSLLPMLLSIVVLGEITALVYGLAKAFT